MEIESVAFARVIGGVCGTKTLYTLHKLGKGPRPKGVHLRIAQDAGREVGESLFKEGITSDSWVNDIFLNAFITALESRGSIGGA